MSVLATLTAKIKDHKDDIFILEIILSLIFSILIG